MPETREGWYSTSDIEHSNGVFESLCCRSREFFSALSNREICQKIMNNGVFKHSNIATVYSNLGVVDQANYIAALSERKYVRKS